MPKTTKAPKKVNSPEYFEYLAQHYAEQAKVAATYNVPEVVCRNLDMCANVLFRCAGELRRASNGCKT